MFNKYSVSILSIIFLILISIKPLDRTPLEETDYYKATISNIEKSYKNYEETINGDTIKVGWAKESLVPTFSTPMAGYGARKGADYEGINDSIWVRSVVFDNGINKSAYVSMDLLIVPPNLDKEKIAEGLGISSRDIFFTASHTHSSIGGYLEGLAGNLFGGEYNKKVIEFITKMTKRSIKNAMEDVENAKIGFGSIYASDFITNRLVGDSLGTYDPFLRVIKINRDDKKNATIFSYSAHATCYGHNQKNISGDYPGKVISLLEETREIDFAVYGAGAVGSMSPRTSAKKGERKVNEISSGLFEHLIQGYRSMGVKYETKLGSERIDIELREQSFKINSKIILRPWLFKFLVGDTPKYLSFLRIGDLLVVGTPCDFSGELVEPIEKSISNKSLNLMINSFNGGYIGYVTDDKWYDMEGINTYETYTMNWYGPFNGKYFSDLIKKIIQINEKN